MAKLKKESILTLLAEGQIVIGDGAMGTQLRDRVNHSVAYLEELNLIGRDDVQSTHEDYIRAGAQLIETNTFGVNAHKYRNTPRLYNKRIEIIQRAVEIAQTASLGRAWIAGAVGPLSIHRHELDQYTDTEIRYMYREIFEAMLTCGVDILLLETFTRLSDLEHAVAAAKDIEIPIMAQMAFGDFGVTDSGVSVAKFQQLVDHSNISIVGSNCRVGPHLMPDNIEMLSVGGSHYISCFSNAGYAQNVDGRYVYGASPEYFASKVKDYLAYNAQIIGGCCGTGPDHIQAIKRYLSENRISKVKTMFLSKSSPDHANRHEQKLSESRVLQRIKDTRDTFVTVEIEPLKTNDFSSCLEGIRMLAEHNCDALNIPDNPLSIVRMNNLVFSHIIKQRFDLPIILHIACRDKNLLALQSDLMGADAIGIDSILAVTGDPASIGGQPGASSVFDVNSTGLIELIESFNKGRQLPRRKDEVKTNFSIGVALNPNAPGKLGLYGALKKLEKKVQAGAHYVETQPFYDIEVLDRFLDALDQVPVPVCIGLMPIVSYRNAEFLHNEVPGIRISENLRASFKGLKKAEAMSLGLGNCIKMVDRAKQSGVTNFYLIPPFENYALIAKLIDYIKQGKMPSDVST